MKGRRGLESWVASALLFAVWLFLAFVLGKGGFIHFLLLGAIGVAFVQFMQDRRAALK